MASVSDWLEKNRYIPVSITPWWISATSNKWEDAEFLQHPVFEWSQYFRDIQCMSSRRISATPGEIVVAEFRRHPVNEWSQSFCDTQYMSGRRISVTLSEWVVTRFALILNISLITYLAGRRPFMRFTTNYGFRPCFRSAVKVYNIHISGLWYIVLSWVITSA